MNGHKNREFGRREGRMTSQRSLDLKLLLNGTYGLFGLIFESYIVCPVHFAYDNGILNSHQIEIERMRMPESFERDALEFTCPLRV